VSERTVSELEMELATVRGARDGAKLRAEMAEEVALSLLQPTRLIVKQMGSSAYQSLLMDDAHQALRAAWELPDTQMLLRRLNGQADPT